MSSRLADRSRSEFGMLDVVSQPAVSSARMHTLIRVLFFSTVCFVLATTGAGAAEPSAGPIAVIEAFHQALEAGDGETALTHLSPDVVIYEGGGVEASRDEYASHHLQSDMNFLQAVETKVLGRSSGMDGEHAWVLTMTETTGTWKDEPVHLVGTETMILEETPAGWKIIHIHWSSRAKRNGH